MIRSTILALTLSVAVLTPPAATAQEAPPDEIEAALRAYLASRPDLMENLVREALAKNPQILRSALAEAIRSRVGAAGGAQPPSPAPGATAPRVTEARPAQPDRRAAVRAVAGDLFNSPRQVTIGPAQAVVSVVEFFDYNCGFCRRAADDKRVILEAHPDVRYVLKELPILGPGSLEAAQVAVAVRMQNDTQSRLYLDFNRRMFQSRGQANRASALEAAREAGADMSRLMQDLGSDEVRATIEESMRLARSLSISGTPTYVIGDQIVAGAVGADALRSVIARVRPE